MMDAVMGTQATSSSSHMADPAVAYNLAYGVDVNMATDLTASDSDPEMLD